MISEVDGTTYRALRVTSREVDYGLLGMYRVGLLSGTMSAGLAGGSDIFQARWTDATRLALVWGVQLNGVAGTGIGFTAGTGIIGLNMARGWTVDGSGGTLVAFTGNRQALRSSMGPSLMGSMRVATTNALGGGTKTYDTQGFGGDYFPVPATTGFNFAGQSGMYGSSLEDGGNCAPIVLAQNEGVSLVASVPATGTWLFGVGMFWSEVASY
jgi:hypothetical protein